MITVVFECATIRDAVSKAARVAPTGGSAFDKSAGILLELRPENSTVIVRANNTEVFYLEVVNAVSMTFSENEDQDATGPILWLLPSVLLDGICSKLSIVDGAQVKFENNIHQVFIKQRRMVAKLLLQNSDYYTLWNAFDPSDLETVEGFGKKLQAVAWAASRTGTPPVTGINLNGEHAAATDNYRVAMLPCKLPSLYEPVTIPYDTIKSLGGEAEVKVGRTENRLLVMPNESTQIEATIYAQKFPPITRVFKRGEPQAVLIKRDELSAMVDHAMVMGKTEKVPLLQMIVGRGELAVLMEGRELGLLGDVIELGDQCQHERVKIGLTPESLLGALGSAPNNEVTIWYHLEPKKPIRIDGGSGYEALIMPRTLDKGE